MNEIVKVFEGRTVRIIEGNGEPLFVGKDVCLLLGYKDPTNAMKQHCRGVVKCHPIIDSLGRKQDARVLSEPDVMRLICGSKLPAAIRFEKWVFEEVLPSIRGTGVYVAPNLGIEQLAALAKKIGEMAKHLISENAELREKNAFLEQFCPKGELGEPSAVNGLPKCRQRRGCYVSDKGRPPRRLNPDTNGYLQHDLFLDFLPAVLIGEAVNIINIHCPKLLEDAANA